MVLVVVSFLLLQSGEDSYPRGVIPLQGVRITPVDSARFKRQNCFEICHPVRIMWISARLG